MADPVSIAPSAAGLIALNLESCRLSVNFCDNWRGFGDDVDNVRLKATGLLSTLTLIQSLLSNITTVHRAITADIMAKVGDNEQIIKKVHDLVSNWHGMTQSSGLGCKVWVAGRSMTYPFRKEALFEAVKILEGLQLNLHTTFLVSVPTLHCELLLEYSASTGCNCSKRPPSLNRPR
jgi:hypothetical protein